MWKPSMRFPLFKSFPEETGFNLENNGEWDESKFRLLGFRERIRVMAITLAEQGSGWVSSSMLLFIWNYILKLALYLYLLYSFLLSRYSNQDPTSQRTLMRFICFNGLWEASGLGCGAGPFSGRFLLPFSAFFHFVYMGTAKIPSFPSSRFNQTRRGLAEVLFFALFLNFSSVLAFSPQAEVDGPMYALVSGWIFLGLTDQVFFIAARSELYLSILILFLLTSTPQESLEGIKLVIILTQLWNGVAKQGEWYAYEVSSMLSSSPFLPVSMKRKLYEDWPKSLQPSMFSRLLAWLVPVLQVVSGLALLGFGGQAVTQAGFTVLVVSQMTNFLKLPQSMPIERNLAFLVITFLAFTPTWFSLKRPMLQSFEMPTVEAVDFSQSSFTTVLHVTFVHIVLPLFALLRRMSTEWMAPFSCGEFAGNVGSSIWLIKRDAVSKFNKLVTFSDLPQAQLQSFYELDVVTQCEYRIFVGKLMHFIPRAFLEIIPSRFENKHDKNALTTTLDRYFVLDGDSIANLVVGWTFIDGHHHFAGSPSLISEIQQRCTFAKDELMMFEVDPLPIFDEDAPCNWRMRNENGIVMEQGSISRETLRAIRL